MVVDNGQLVRCPSLKPQCNSNTMHYPIKHFQTCGQKTTQTFGGEEGGGGQLGECGHGLGHGHAHMSQT